MEGLAGTGTSGLASHCFWKSALKTFSPTSEQIHVVRSCRDGGARGEIGGRVLIDRRAAPITSHCAGERIIGGAALRCLVANGPSLQPACKSELSRLGQRF